MSSKRDGVRRSEVPRIGKAPGCMDCEPDTTNRISAPGEACSSCGRYVASVDEHVSIGGIVCRVTTTHAGG